MTVRIIKRKDGMYDCYEKTSGRYLFSSGSPDKVFLSLMDFPCIRVLFVDEGIEKTASE